MDNPTNTTAEGVSNPLGHPTNTTAEGRIADALGAFLIALAGGDPQEIGKCGEALRSTVASAPDTFETAFLVGMVRMAAMASMLRHHERNCLGAAAHAWGAARLALEMRLEAILEDLHRAADVCGAMGLGAGKAVS